jgi:hypothetical protein
VRWKVERRSTVTREEIEQKENDEKVYSFLVFLMVAPLILTKGGAFYLLYKWFVSSMTNYQIGFWQMVGLAILANTTSIAFREPRTQDRPAKEIFNACWIRMCGYTASILFGWLAKLMM